MKIWLSALRFASLADAALRERGGDGLIGGLHDRDGTMSLHLVRKA
jgi:hypothetical protein